MTKSNASKKPSLRGDATTKVVSGSSSNSLIPQSGLKLKKKEVVVSSSKKKKKKKVGEVVAEVEKDDPIEEEESNLPDIAIRVPESFDLEDPDGIVNRTKAILLQLDAERKLNPLSEDSSMMYDFFRAALAETLELIPKAKRAYMRYQSQSNANAYNGLVTKCQELLADIQALDDRGGALERILDQTIVPSFMGIISNLGNSYTMSIARARTVRGLSESQIVEVENIIKDLSLQTAKYIQETKTSLETTLRGQLSEDD
jgi:hypothetical protein